MNHRLTSATMTMAATAPAPDAAPWAQWWLAGVVILHFIESNDSGTNVLALAILHFN